MHIGLILAESSPSSWLEMDESDVARAAKDVWATMKCGSI